MIEVPASEATEVLADWAEASCLFGNQVSLSEYELEETLEGAGIQDTEEVVSNIWLEIDSRHRAGGEAYPVNLFPGRLERTCEWHVNSAYAFQLLLACQSYYHSFRRSRPGWRATAKLFEQLSTLALQQYLDGSAINFGAPREGQVPQGFDDALQYLCRNLGEAGRTERLYTSRTKDDGVDIVAWRPFNDGRPSQVSILVQCAAGANWRSKTKEISLGVWREHVDWATDPLKAFAFPYVCIDDTKWLRLSKETEGLLLDRLRIASLFMAGGDSFSTVRAQLKHWCQGQLARLPWLGR